ncbi:MAG: type VI secretion system ImpA family N-terminal domain-containing protein [Planctomycetota bacterium]
MLSPIRDDAASGDPPEALGALLDEVRSHRKSDDPAVTNDPQQANWSRVAKACAKALQTQTKHLELAAYLAEALTRRKPGGKGKEEEQEFCQHGFAGLRDGLRLLTGLLGEPFWDSVHPGVEEEGIDLDIRAKWLTWVGSSKEFRAAVSAVALTGSGHGWADKLEADRLDALLEPGDAESQKKAQKEVEILKKERGKLTGDLWRANVDATGGEALAAVAVQIKSCEEALTGLEERCAEVFVETAQGSEQAEAKPHDAMPSFYLLRSLLETIRTYLNQQCGAGNAIGETEGSAGEIAVATTADPADGAGQTTTAVPRAAAGSLQTRDAALRQLAAVSRYFRQFEPHSPISLLIERAVLWGQLPFEKVMDDLMKGQLFNWLKDPPSKD